MIRPDRGASARSREAAAFIVVSGQADLFNAVHAASESM